KQPPELAPGLLNRRRRWKRRGGDLILINPSHCLRSSARPNQMPRVFIRTFGCQMNEYDSARMVDVLRETGGYEVTDDPAQADLLLLNTCSVREKAQEKVFSQLGGWKQL